MPVLSSSIYLYCREANQVLSTSWFSWYISYIDVHSNSNLPIMPTQTAIYPLLNFTSKNVHISCLNTFCNTLVFVTTSTFTTFIQMNNSRIPHKSVFNFTYWWSCFFGNQIGIWILLNKNYFFGTIASVTLVWKLYSIYLPSNTLLNLSSQIPIYVLLHHKITSVCTVLLLSMYLANLANKNGLLYCLRHQLFLPLITVLVKRLLLLVVVIW